MASPKQPYSAIAKCRFESSTGLNYLGANQCQINHRNNTVSFHSKQDVVIFFFFLNEIKSELWAEKEHSKFSDQKENLRQIVHMKLTALSIIRNAQKGLKYKHYLNSWSSLKKKKNQCLTGTLINHRKKWHWWQNKNPQCWIASPGRALLLLIHESSRPYDTRIF